jgi:alpha/beta superfamily hydrolase
LCLPPHAIPHTHALIAAHAHALQHTFVLSGFGFGAEVLMERIEECRSIRQAKAKKPEEKPPAATDDESEDGDGMGTMRVQGDDDEVCVVCVVSSCVWVCVVCCVACCLR